MKLKVTQHGERPAVVVNVPDDYNFKELNANLNDQSLLTVCIGDSVFHRGMIESVIKEG